MVAVPAGPIVGISCLANVAPIWNDTIATGRADYGCGDRRAFFMTHGSPL